MGAHLATGGLHRTRDTPDACEDFIMCPRVCSTVLAAVCLIATPAAGREDARSVLAKARQYVASYDRQLVALIADERYVQTGRVAEGTATETRVLESEFGWVAIPAVDDTIGVREVRRVDGRPVAGARRLRELLQRPQEHPSGEVRAILAESATHNLGDVRRNINFPTFALAYLRSPREHDTRWRVVRSGDHVDLHFEERDRSTLVRTPEGLRSPARGRFSVDPGTGRITALELRVRVRDGRSSRPMFYWMLVDFACDARLDVWVPVRMLERHYRNRDRAAHSGESGEATYGNYRRFEGTGRLLQ
jgi:hypothetical protein